MFENPRRGRQARNFTANVPKILDLKSSSEQIFSRKLSLGAPAANASIIATATTTATANAPANATAIATANANATAIATAMPTSQFTGPTTN